jgi:hypothetical protein
VRRKITPKIKKAMRLPATKPGASPRTSADMPCLHCVQQSNEEGSLKFRPAGAGESDRKRAARESRRSDCSREDLDPHSDDAEQRQCASLTLGDAPVLLPNMRRWAPGFVISRGVIGQIADRLFSGGSVASEYQKRVADLSQSPRKARSGEPFRPETVDSS